MNEQLAQLQAEVAELMAWKQARELQAIPYPLDEASKNTLNVVSTEGTLTSGLTQSVSVPSTPTNITVPAAFAGTLTVVADGVKYKVPYTGTI